MDKHLEITLPEFKEPIQYPLDVSGIQTRVLECGSGNKSILCLHGAGSRADRWRHNLVPLAEQGYHVFAIDFPGHGLAQKTADIECSAPAFAEFIASFIQIIGDQVTIFGTSLGGMVAGTVACNYPDLVKAAVLIGTPGFVKMPPVPSGGISKGGVEGMREKLEFLVYDNALVTNQLLAEETRMNSTPEAKVVLEKLAAYIADGVQKDFIGDRYAKLNLPTLLVWGKDDMWVPLKVGLDSQEVLGGAPLVIMSSAAHAPYFERPTEFNAVAVNFLQGKITEKVIEI